MSKTPVFPVLQDLSSEDGNAWHTMAIGDAVGTRDKGGVIVAKDPSDNAAMLSVDANNRLIISDESDALVDLNGEGDNVGNTSFVDLFDIVLQATTVYKNLDWSVACFRECTFEILIIDDEGVSDVETILATIKVSAGQFTHASQKISNFTSGSTGAQVLRVRAKNLNATSQMEACTGIQEIQ